MQKAELKQNLLSAIQTRQLDQLSNLLVRLVEEVGVEAGHHFLRCSVLTELDPADNEWFWANSTSRLQYQKLLNKVYEGSLGLLISQGKLPGKDFSSIIESQGRRQILVSSDTMQELKDALPKDRHSSLSLVVQATPTNKH